MLMESSSEISETPAWDRRMDMMSLDKFSKPFCKQIFAISCHFSKEQNGSSITRCSISSEKEIKHYTIEFLLLDNPHLASLHEEAPFQHSCSQAGLGPESRAMTSAQVQTLHIPERRFLLLNCISSALCAPLPPRSSPCKVDGVEGCKAVSSESEEWGLFLTVHTHSWKQVRAENLVLGSS